MSNIPKNKEDELQDSKELLFPHVSWLRTQVKEDKINMMGIFTIRVPFLDIKLKDFVFVIFQI
jgi:hypothetical protein